MDNHGRNTIGLSVANSESKSRSDKPCRMVCMSDPFERWCNRCLDTDDRTRGFSDNCVRIGSKASEGFLNMTAADDKNIGLQVVNRFAYCGSHTSVGDAEWRSEAELCLEFLPLFACAFTQVTPNFQHAPICGFLVQIDCVDHVHAGFLLGGKPICPKNRIQTTL